MDSEIQRKEIANSLRTVTEIFESSEADYRIIGSVLLVAHTNRVFRRINDIDILLDIKSRDVIFQKIRNLGFQFENKRKAGFSWIEAKKEGYLGLTFFLIGEFKKDYFGYQLSNFIELRIRSDYLKPTEYIFENIKFVGIPVSSAIAGIRQAFLNPKRKLDKQIIENDPENIRVKVYNNISVFMLGIKLPYLYDVFSFFYNIYGGIRVMFGQKYEIWD